MDVKVALTSREKVLLMFRFPTNTLGRTRREWPLGNTNNPPNEFFNPTDTTRDTARRTWMQYFIPLVEKHLNQASVGVYWTVDNSNTLVLDGFFGHGFITGHDGDPLVDGDETTEPAYRRLSRLVDQNPNLNWDVAINVFLCEQVVGLSTAGDVQKGGATLLDVRSAPVAGQPVARGGRVVLLSDRGSQAGATGETNDAILAHEMAHAVSAILDIFKERDIDGKINNMRPIFDNQLYFGADPRNPMNWNLMRWLVLGQRQDVHGRWLTGPQTWRMRSRAIIHPAWHSRD